MSPDKRSNAEKTHHKRVQALVRYMRSQKVQAFSVDGLSVTFSPEAFAEPEPQPVSVPDSDGFASDDERLEHMRDNRGRR